MQEQWSILNWKVLCSMPPIDAHHLCVAGPYMDGFHESRDIRIPRAFSLYLQNFGRCLFA